jgi:hypothetical protein
LICILIKCAYKSNNKKSFESKSPYVDSSLTSTAGEPFLKKTIRKKSAISLMSSAYFSLSLSEVGHTLWEADADEVVNNIRSFA